MGPVNFTPRLAAPGTYPLWEDALTLLNRDLAATLPEQRPLRLMSVDGWDGTDGPEDVYIALANGESHGHPLSPESARDPAAALAAVADAAQDTVTERLWQAWPVCPEHDLGMHLYEDDAGVPLGWWCAGGPAHIRAAVGALDTLVRPHRRRNRERSV